MKKMTIVSMYDPLGDVGGSVYVFDVGDDLTKADVINKCVAPVYDELCKDYMDEDGTFELPDYDRTIGDVLGEVADNILVQRALAMQGIEFVECFGGAEFVDNDQDVIDMDGTIWKVS